MTVLQSDTHRDMCMLLLQKVPSDMGTNRMKQKLPKLNYKKQR